MVSQPESSSIANPRQGQCLSVSHEHCYSRITIITEAHYFHSATMSNARNYFFLKVKACTNSAYVGQYLRYTSGGHADIVITPEPPKFIKFFQEDGKLLAGFDTRVWGMCMSTEGAEIHSGTELEKAEIFENRGDTGFFFDDTDGLLKWAPGEGFQTGEPISWKGWVLRENTPDVYKGFPQLFWLGQAVSREKLPKGVENLEIVAEYF
ncbi:hypothetical protein BT63DRAFT_428651 [Microthyrium microscopicum]|uniref:DUF7907 domain-containing protein n=1 Tax=Microthyrium microscopicum TaxID=703497 RepID=A0A6A6U1B3_9PEZI|nr:hypothetical protein BT63DRAFT_428651 [Microthyrium microscopicum]